MYIIDKAKWREALKRGGYRSNGELANDLGLHRNTIQYYLNGRPVFPEGVEKIFNALRLRPWDILIEKPPDRLLSLEPIAPVADQLHAEFPGATLVLFGSRARGTARRYSDWDLGVYSRHGIEHGHYLRMLAKKDDIEEDLPYFIDLVNLNRADSSFLKGISGGWMFLAGSQQDWFELQRKAS